MPRLLPSYLHTLRMRCGLSQPELAELLGIDPTLLSKVESLARQPTAKVILAAEIVFGVPAREIFPGAYSGIETHVVQRARALQDKLEHSADAAPAEKLRLLKDIVSGKGPSKKGV